MIAGWAASARALENPTLENRRTPIYLAVKKITTPAKEQKKARSVSYQNASEERKLKP